MGAIFFWVIVLLMALSVFTPPAWKAGPYISTGLVVVAFILLGLKVFGFAL
jgi:hypothetical protein